MRWVFCVLATLVVSGCGSGKDDDSTRRTSHVFTTQKYQLMTAVKSGENFRPGVWVLNTETGGVEFCSQPTEPENIVNCEMEVADNFR